LLEFVMPFIAEFLRKRKRRAFSFVNVFSARFCRIASRFLESVPVSEFLFFASHSEIERGNITGTT